MLGSVSNRRKKMFKKIAKKIIAPISIAAFLMVQIAPASAAMISTDRAVEQSFSTLDIAQVQQMFDRDDVQQQLVALGVSAEDAQARVALMTDAELAQLNSRMGSLEAGSDILGIALTVFIVLVITDMVGATDVLPFVKPIN
jgi:BMFP domain-containing protein YqiC